jgi:hypothetical protein
MGIRFDKELNAVVRQASFKLESARHNKLAKYAQRHKRTIDDLLRERTIDWIDNLELTDPDEEQPKRAATAKRKKRT